MIEKYIQDYLTGCTEVPVYVEEPQRPPKKYILVDKLGSSVENHILSASVAIQSYGSSRLEAAQLNENVKAYMEAMATRPEISRCKLNSDYPFMDTATKRHRYQAVFDITHY